MLTCCCLSLKCMECVWLCLFRVSLVSSKKPCLEPLCCQKLVRKALASMGLKRSVIVSAVGGDLNKASAGLTGGVQVDVYIHYAQLLQYTDTANTLTNLGVSEKWLKCAHVKPPRPTAADSAPYDSPRLQSDNATDDVTTTSDCKPNCYMPNDDGVGGSDYVEAQGQRTPILGGGSGGGTMVTAPPIEVDAVTSSPGMISSAEASVTDPSFAISPTSCTQESNSPSTLECMHSTPPAMSVAAAPAPSSLTTRGGEVVGSPSDGGLDPEAATEPPFSSHPLRDEVIAAMAATEPTESSRVCKAARRTNACGNCGPDCASGANGSTSAEVKRTQLYDIAGFLRSQLWLGCYRGPPPLGVDLFIMIQLYCINWDSTGTEKRRRIPVLAAGLLATRTATKHEALPGCMWMGDLSVEGSVGRARLEAKECLGEDVHTQQAMHGVVGSAEGVEKDHKDESLREGVGGEKEESGVCGRWVHLREWFEEVQELSGGNVGELGADFVLVRPYGETVLGRAAAELWLSQNEGMCLCMNCLVVLEISKSCFRPAAFRNSNLFCLNVRLVTLTA